MKGPRAQKSLVDKIRPMNPRISTGEVQDQLIHSHLYFRIFDLHTPPITSGMKYHVFLLATWKVCSNVVRPKAATKTIAAVREG